MERPPHGGSERGNKSRPTPEQQQDAKRKQQLALDLLRTLDETLVHGENSVIQQLRKFQIEHQLERSEEFEKLRRGQEARVLRMTALLEIKLREHLGITPQTWERMHEVLDDERKRT